jgi:succinate-semialdehyde dehydrogenase/glutarate-semialdehyde dehydrogenase
VTAVGDLVAEALAAGARRVTREPELPSQGSYAAPALLVGVPDTAGLARTEIFGPAAGVFPFSDEEEALERANATEMGLAAYFYSRDAARTWRVGERLEAGIVGVNHALPSVAFAPMGGVKQSGLGREGAALGLEEFEEPRYLSIGL